MKKLFLSLIVLTVAAAVFAGCTQSKPAEQPKEEPKAAEPAKEEPASIGTEFTGESADGKLSVKMKVAGTVALVEMTAKEFTWNKTYAAKEPEDPKNNGNEGHAILTLDSNEPAYVGTLRHALSNLTPGEHTLKVELVNNDNSPKGVEATIKFTVK